MNREETIDWLLARVRADEDTKCLVWARAVNSSGVPVASVDGAHARNVRRWLYERLVGAVAEGKKLVPSCRNPLCLNVIEHCSQLTPAQVNALLASEGRLSTPAKLAQLRKMGRAQSPHSMETAELARSMRAGNSKLREIAAATGMSISTASQVCRGERWAPTLEGASVFSWKGPLQ